jgi:putative transcriptional regulator
MEERERAIERIRGLLEKVGFVVSDAHGIRPTSFDLLARRDSLLVMLKVLKNIDALAPEEAARLRELSELLQAVPLIVGQTSGASRLESGVVYTRYSVPIVTEPALAEYLERGVPLFLLSSPGGIFAQIDGARLRALREARGLSLGTLAGVAGVTRRTIQLYEEGGGAEVTVVERMETYLQDTIALPIHLFPAHKPPPKRPRGAEEEKGDEERSERTPVRTGDVLRDAVFRELDTMGWEVEVTVRCPFDAFTHADEKGEKEILLTSVGSLRTAIHRAEVLQGLARVLEGHSMFVTREAGTRTSVEGLPLVTIRELHRHRDRSELVELLHEREGA